MGRAGSGARIGDRVESSRQHHWRERAIPSESTTARQRSGSDQAARGRESEEVNGRVVNKQAKIDTVANLGADELAILSLLSRIAAGRPQFEARVEELRKCSRCVSSGRFKYVIRKLAARGLVKAELVEDPGFIRSLDPVRRWKLELRPGWVPRPIEDGERVFVPRSKYGGAVRVAERNAQKIKRRRFY